jgi:sulfur-carrier protein adenylyltransferase/sulfurtransferase
MDNMTIQPDELKALLDRGSAPVLLDVRQPEEIAAASIDGAVCIPMGEVPARIGELDGSKPTVVFCHHGVRSQHVAAHLRRAGFKDVKSLGGGIDAWSAVVDPGVPRYEFDGRSVRAHPARGR